jgi:anti-anti-sigma factor
VRGELDLTNASALDEALLQTSARAVILDLDGLDFVDSAGMRAIDRAHRRLADDGRMLLIVAPGESRAAWTFRVAGFADGAVLESVELAQRRAADNAQA